MIPNTFPKTTPIVLLPLTSALQHQQPKKSLRSASSGLPPAIQQAPSAGSASLAYSMETDAMADDRSGGDGNHQQQRAREELPPRIQPAPTAESLDYSIYSSGEMSAEQYYAQHNIANQYQEQIVQPQQQLQEQELATVDEYRDENYDATPTVHEMHRKLLYLLSHPELFSEAMDWQAKVDRGLDPSRPDSWKDGELAGGGNGIKSFDNEFEEQSGPADEQKDDAASTQTSDTKNTASSKFKDQNKLIPPLPLQIFAADAEVVLPQALTASQLFGIERVTGIELEAAAGTVGLSQLFLRWLALMPEGDHANVVDPPGLTVMRISGGRYRVTGAHRVVWRWMNKFSPASVFAVPSDERRKSGEEGGDVNANAAPDTDFDFGDLVTMTIVDVFETDADGRLLSYCPTFDNRAVHKTQEVTERLRKGASHLKEGFGVVARSPAGKSVNKAAGHFGKFSFSAALAVGDIVKRKIEEEIHKHQNPEHGGCGGGGGGDSEASSDAVDGDESEETSRGEEQSAAPPGRGKGAPKGESYSSEESDASRRMEV